MLTVTESAPIANTIARYQGSLPYVKAHDDAGQWELFDAPEGIPELGPVAELAALDVETLNLFTSPGVLRHATRWRRHREGGAEKHRSWRQLDLALEWRNNHLGYLWEARHLRVLDDVEAQTWNLEDVQRRRFRVPWLADAIVSTLDGSLLKVPHQASPLLLLAMVIDCAESGTGGIHMSLPDWGAALGCNPRTFYNHRKLLGNLIRHDIVYRPTPNMKGSRKGYVLVRIGPDLEQLVALHAASRKEGGKRGSKLRRSAGLLLAACLLARGHRRRRDVAESYWRGHRRLANPSRRPTPNRQILPHCPPSQGLSDQVKIKVSPEPKDAPPESLYRTRSARATPTEGPPEATTGDHGPVLPAPDDKIRDGASGQEARAFSPRTAATIERAPPRAPPETEPSATRIGDAGAWTYLEVGGAAEAFAHAEASGGDLQAMLEAATAAFGRQRSSSSAG